MKIIRSPRTAAISDILQAVPVAIAVLDADAFVVEANAMAKALMKRWRGTSIVDGRLRFTEAQAQRQFESILSRSPALGAKSSAATSIPVRCGERDGIVHILRLRRNSELLDGARRYFLATAFIEPRQRAAGLSWDEIARMFDLTNAETRILTLLFKGLSTADIAAERGVAQTTVKTHLRRIYSKTGTSRRPELIFRIATLHPQP
jgi:DNA-binding CsgD family transcriptional regulator